ncbi:MAG TPA: NADH-quinone oxidoreductase subunit H, partial [Thermodesulfobacteriota bacterium]|nr:NADH-quinone oxidoreductase subunit H [Thermodesulfobacteriota bacterium]
MNGFCMVYQSFELLQKMLAFILLAPLIGGLLAGVDRKVTARLQGRYGPPVLQPFYDVLKLFQKETIVVNKLQNFAVLLFLIFTVFSGALFFAGADLLLMVFTLALASTFFVL